MDIYVHATRICYAVLMQDAETTLPEEASALDEASRTLFRLGRAFGRMPMSDLLEASAGRGTELSAILLVQAVEAAATRGGEVTIGGVAEQLGVDPSTASRLVAQSVQSGLLQRVASQVDGRARGLLLTQAGRALADGAARYQRAVFDAATIGWTEVEREEFARLFVRFADAIVAALREDRRA
jgi:DNA-binding MarR family transcriptional regulator